MVMVVLSTCTKLGTIVILLLVSPPMPTKPRTGLDWTGPERWKLHASTASCPSPPLHPTVVPRRLSSDLACHVRLRVCFDDMPSLIEGHARRLR